MPGTKVAKVSCEDCFFKQNLLCALDCDAPCPTFRPNHPEGLGAADRAGAGRAPRVALAVGSTVR